MKARIVEVGFRRCDACVVISSRCRTSVAQSSLFLPFRCNVTIVPHGRRSLVKVLLILQQNHWPKLENACHRRFKKQWFLYTSDILAGANHGFVSKARAAGGNTLGKATVVEILFQQILYSRKKVQARWI
jgi:hypothetical protein